MKHSSAIPLAPVKRRIFEDILQYFVEFIGSGQVKSGDRLLSERELASQLAVSRASLREALRTLEFFGLLSVIPGQGTFISPPDSNALAVFFELILSLRPTSYENIMEVRRIIEYEAVRLAARRASREEVAQLKEALDRMPRDVSADDIGVQADLDFHTVIMKATHNNILILLYKSIENLLKRTYYERRAALFKIPGGVPRIFNVHEAIYQAIAARDEQKSTDGMRNHFALIEIHESQGMALSSQSSRTH